MTEETPNSSPGRDLAPRPLAGKLDARDERLGEGADEGVDALA